MKLSLTVRKWHKWLSLVIGIQLFFWTVSGLFMSYVPINEVRSENIVKKEEIKTLEVNNLVSIESLILANKIDNTAIESITSKMFLNRPVYEVKYISGEIVLFDARVNSQISPVSEEQIKKVFDSRYSGDARIKKISLVNEKIIEYRSKYPVWRVDLDDNLESSFYFSPENGNLKAVRNNIWRIYDFLWMLHIMDYSERDNFNHWWLVISAILANLLVTTGIVLIFYSYKTKYFKFFKKKH